MRVLVAGASGALGIPLTRRLVAAGHEVIGLSRRPGNRDMLRALGAEPLIADAMDRAALLRAVDGVKADAVVHQLTDLKKAPMLHRDMAATNALREQGTANLLAAAEVVGARRFVAQSMIFGYGYGDWGSKVITEDDPFAPAGRGRFERHLAAMRSVEQQTFGTPGIEGVAVRYGLFYGPGASLDTLVGLLRSRRLPVPRDGGGHLSWIHVEDAAAATVAALERGGAGQAYNVVDDEPVCWGDFLGAVADAFGTPPPPRLPGWMFRFGYAAGVMTSTLRVSNAKAGRELGWKPSAPTYREGIRALAAARPHERDR